MSAFPVDHDVRVRDLDNALSGDGQHGGRLALMGGQLLVVGRCYLQYRKALAANPAQVPS